MNNKTIKLADEKQVVYFRNWQRLFSMLLSKMRSTLFQAIKTSPQQRLAQLFSNSMKHWPNWMCCTIAVSKLARSKDSASACERFSRPSAFRCKAKSLLRSCPRLRFQPEPYSANSYWARLTIQSRSGLWRALATTISRILSSWICRLGGSKNSAAPICKVSRSQ